MIWLRDTAMTLWSVFHYARIIAYLVIVGFVVRLIALMFNYARDGHWDSFALALAAIIPAYLVAKVTFVILDTATEARLMEVYRSAGDDAYLDARILVYRNIQDELRWNTVESALLNARMGIESIRPTRPWKSDRRRITQEMDERISTVLEIRSALGHRSRQHLPPASAARTSPSAPPCVACGAFIRPGVAYCTNCGHRYAAPSSGHATLSKDFSRSANEELQEFDRIILNITAREPVRGPMAKPWRERRTTKPAGYESRRWNRWDLPEPDANGVLAIPDECVGVVFPDDWLLINDYWHRVISIRTDLSFPAAIVSPEGYPL